MKRNKIIVYTDLLCPFIDNNTQIKHYCNCERKEIEIDDSEASIALQFIIGTYAKQIKSERYIIFLTITTRHQTLKIQALIGEHGVGYGFVLEDS